MEECPLVTQHVAWEWKGDILKYWFINEFNPAESGKKPTKIPTMKADLQLFSHKFDISLKDANNKIRDQLYRLDILDERSRKYAKTLEATLHNHGQKIM